MCVAAHDMSCMRMFRSGMLAVVHMWNDEVEAFYNDQITDQKRIYSQRFACRSYISQFIHQDVVIYLTGPAIRAYQ